MLKKLIIAASLALASGAQADINIGQSVPTTGIAGETGKALALGASIYFNQVNGRGGVNGEQINHLVRDDGDDPKRTLQNTQDFIDKENAVALISYHGTDNVNALIKAKTLENAGIPLVGVHSGAEFLRSPGSPYLFHTRAGFNQEAERIVKLLTENLGITKFGVLAQKDGFGESGVAALKAALAKKQLKLQAEAWYDRASGDTSKAAKDLAKVNPEVVILVAHTKPAATFVENYKNNGGTSQLYAFSAVQFEDISKQIGKRTAHGLGISQVLPYPYNTRARIVQEFQDDVYAELGSGMSGKKESLAAISKYPSYAMLEGYISARIIVEALKRAGKSPTLSLIHI